MLAAVTRQRRWLAAGLLAAAVPVVAPQARDLARIDAASTLPAAARATPPAAAQALLATNAAATLDAATGVPTFVWASDVAATPSLALRAVAPKAGTDAEATARAWLARLAPLYRLDAGDAERVPLHDLQRLPDGAALARFRNAFAGIEVFREESNVLVDRTGALVAVGGYVTGAPAVLRKRAASFGDADAVAVALADFGFARDIAGAFTVTAGEGGYSRLALPPEARSNDGARLVSARAKPVWFRLGTDLRPARYVEIVARDQDARRSDHYAYVVDDDGTLLYRRNQAAHAAFSYRVFAEPTAPYLPYPTPAGRAGFPHPTGTPDGYQPPNIGASLVTLANLPFSRNDPWLPANATRTIGNNVEAYADLIAPELFGPAASNECNNSGPLDGDLHACVTGGTSFDHPYDFAKDPFASRAQVTPGVTQVFYLLNWLHDWFYDAGFDEKAGNAQTDNYGRGGLGNDNIVAVTQDYTEVSDAYMITPADGQHPELHLFVWLNDAALFKVTTPASLAGLRNAGTADFGSFIYDLTADLVAATGPGGATDGCVAYANAAAVRARIVLVDRGACPFVTKAAVAQAAGAAALVVVNSSNSTLNMTGDDPTITIPVVSLIQNDGKALREALAVGARVSLRLASDFVLREGALDTMVAAHEWGHYISSRLIGNSNGLDENQAGGLGEGWGDFHEMLLLVKDEDRQLAANAGFNGTYSSNAFSLSGPGYPPDVPNNAYYYGDRRYPYTRDMTKNPLTFRHIMAASALPAAPVPSLTYSSPDNSEVHNSGEVWASMLWECYSNLLRDTGRLTFAQAQDRMKRYLVAAYKMTPVNPTFVTARDALLAVMQAQDAQDRALCLAGFAKRGLGVGAVAPPANSTSNNGVLESFMAALPASGARVTAIEYYHAGFDHYFVTSLADEIAKLDNGTFAGWTRTGESFTVYSDAPPGSAPVCRFFSTAFDPKSSHFYTPDANECGVVTRNASWQLESRSVFAIPSPGPVGECPAGSAPVYRLYNNGQGNAPNHRYTTSLATRTTMLGKGWIPEGYGPLGVIMCTPS